MSKSGHEENSFMFRASELIVKLKPVLAAVFIVIVIFSVFSMSWVNVENDITVYLPDSAEAKAGLLIMEDEFITYASADVMVENVTLDEAQKIYDTISGIDGVVLVNFDTSEGHYSDNCAMYNVTFQGVETDEKVKTATAELKEKLSDYSFYVYSETLTNINDIIIQEMKSVLVIVVIVVLLVLLFTSSTYGEVLVLIGTFTAAALINMGTNFLLGTISFISNSVAIVLQLALSLDYAIIFCNRYKEEHKLLPIKEAVTAALAHSIPEISASSLTTIAGLTAMTFMKFKLGLDMGIALIKAILCSLITVFLFMPVLLLACGKLMDKTKHKSFVPKINFAGKFAYATRMIIPPLFALLVVFAYIKFTNCDYAYSMQMITCPHQNENDIAQHEVESRFGKNNLIALMVPSGDYEKEEQLAEELDGCKEVNRVLGLAYIEAVDGYRLADKVNYHQFMDIAGIDEQTAQALFAYYAAGQEDYRSAKENIENYSVPLVDIFLLVHDVADTGVVELQQEQTDLINSLYDQLRMAQDQLQGENYSRLLVYIDLPQQGDDTFAFLERMHVIAAQYYSEGVVLTGNAVSASDFNNTFKTDNMVVGILSLTLVMLILLLTFKSIGMPVLLIMVIQGSIWINFAIPVIRNQYVFFMCYLIVSSIQMGANIDYAIVISSRYRELRAKDLSQQDAITQTLNLAFPTVITSGTIMIVAGLLIGQRVSQVVVSGMGTYVGIGTAISILLVNFALPQILMFGERFVQATTVHASGRLLGKTPRRAVRGIASLLLAAAAVFAIVAAPMSRAKAAAYTEKNVEYYKSLVSTTGELQALADELKLGKEQYDSMKMEFAEHLVTDNVGSEMLEEGEQQIEQGEDTLNAAKRKLAAGEAQYAEGEAQYEAGKKKLADGQAQYDEGEAKLAAAKQEYADGQAQLDEVTPLYNAVMPRYNEYKDLEAQYNAAVAAGDTETASSLKPRLDLAKWAFESQLSGGQSISALITEYNEGQRKLAEGAAQIAEAEQQLADSKVQLDEGYAQLAEAEQQLAEARAQLEDGRRQINAGEGKLGEAKQELEAGRETFDENKQQLESDLSGLDEYADGQERLTAGIDILMGIDGVSDVFKENATYSEVCSTAQRYFSDKLDSIEAENKTAGVVTAVLIAAAVCAVLAVLLLAAFKAYNYSIILSVVSAVAAIICAVAWHFGCPSFIQLPRIAASCLVAFAIAFSVIIHHRHKDESAEPVLSEIE